MVTTAIFPSRYVQGKGALTTHLPQELAALGHKALILQDPVVHNTYRDTVATALHGVIEFDIEVFSSECSDEEIARISARAQEIGADVIVGMGGGKTLDTAKATGASLNREAMMENALAALQRCVEKPIALDMDEINCHHNYVQKEQHFGEEIYVTRKGAVSARRGEFGIIPGSMGAKSFIVRGLGNEESFCSCSHGAGRVMSRTKAKKLFSVDDQIRATAHVECRKDADVIDEIPMAYKDIDAVMAAQSDLVAIMYTLRQVVCVKG